MTDAEITEKLAEIRARYRAFMEMYSVYGGRKGQEVDDIGVLLKIIDYVTAENAHLWADNRKLTGGNT